MAELKDSLCDLLDFSKRDSYMTIVEKFDSGHQTIVRVRLVLVPGRGNGFLKKMFKSMLSQKQVQEMGDFFLNEGMTLRSVRMCWSGVEVIFIDFLPLGGTGEEFPCPCGVWGVSPAVETATTTPQKRGMGS